MDARTLQPLPFTNGSNLSVLRITLNGERRSSRMVGLDKANEIRSIDSLVILMYIRLSPLLDHLLLPSGSKEKVFGATIHFPTSIILPSCPFLFHQVSGAESFFIFFFALEFFLLVLGLCDTYLSLSHYSLVNHSFTTLPPSASALGCSLFFCRRSWAGTYNAKSTFV